MSGQNRMSSNDIIEDIERVSSLSVLHSNLIELLYHSSVSRGSVSQMNLPTGIEWHESTPFLEPIR